MIVKKHCKILNKVQYRQDIAKLQQISPARAVYYDLPSQSSNVLPLLMLATPSLVPDTHGTRSKSRVRVEARAIRKTLEFSDYSDLVHIPNTATLFKKYKFKNTLIWDITTDPRHMLTSF
jgi:hypothetical protein